LDIPLKARENPVTTDPTTAGGVAGEMPKSLGFKLRRLQLAYKRMFMQMAGPDAIPTNQIGALSLIFRNQGITPGDLANLLTIDAAHLTAITKQLEARAMIRREKSATDSRSHSLFTTKEGAAEFTRMQKIIADAEQLFIDNALHDGEVEQLSDMLDRLLAAARSRDRNPGG